MGKIKSFFSLFSRITTGILIFASVYLYIFWGAGEVLSVIVIWELIFNAFICSIGSMLIYSRDNDKEPSKNMLLAKQIICFVYNNAATLVCGFVFGWFRQGDWKMIVGLEICVIVVYTVVDILTYVASSNDAAKMNDRLRNRE